MARILQEWDECKRLNFRGLKRGCSLSHQKRTVAGRAERDCLCNRACYRQVKEFLSGIRDGFGILLQLGKFLFRLLVDRDVRIGIFPYLEEVFVCRQRTDPRSICIGAL